MEIDVTDFVRGADAHDFSASVMERGPTAGPDTWRNAKAEAASTPLLVTDEQIEALRSCVKDFGAWSEEEIAAWDDDDCNALFIQMVAGELRELESLATTDDGEIDWQKARKLSENGTLGGNLYCGDVEGSADFGRVFYYLGS